MKARTAEIEREDFGALLVPMIHVERNITRQTTIISIEIPESEHAELVDRRQAKRWLGRFLGQIGGAFMEQWDRLHPEDLTR